MINKDSLRKQPIIPLILPRRRISDLEEMKADVQNTKDMLQDRGEPYLNFKYAPVSLWEEDFSEIKLYIDRLKMKGVKDVGRYFEKHPEEVISLAGKVKIVEVNEATLKLYQAESIEAFRQGLSAVFDKRSYDVFREELIALSEGKTEFSGEVVNLTCKGEERHVLLKLAVAPGHESSLSKVFVSIIDISDLRHMEKEMEESLEKYRKIFKTSHDAIMVADTDAGIILEANEKAEDLFGMPADEIVGMHFTQLHPKEEAGIHVKQFKDHVSRGGAVSENVVICRKSGDRLLVSISSRVIELKGKKCISAILREMPHKALTKDKNATPPKAAKELSPRECEIVKLIASGLTTKEVAEKLYISSKTVQTHRSRIMQKLNIHRVNDLVRFAVTSGLFE